MIDKDNYSVDKKNGLLERLRGDEISRRIAQETPLSAQVALIMDMIEGKQSKQKEWNEYQAFRSKVKAEVDAEFEEMEKSIIFDEVEYD